MDDQTGLVDDAKHVVQVVANPLPTGYSASVLSTPGLKPALGFGICQYCASDWIPNKRIKLERSRIFFI